MQFLTRGFLVTSLALAASAHMEMQSPPPLRSKYNPKNPSNLVDYSMTSPLAADGSQFPCKGYLGDPQAKTSVATLAVGTDLTLQLSGSAYHNGGSCQLSLSYNGGTSFHPFKSFIGNCPTGPASTLAYSIPADVPSGQAILSWSWMNHVGNREFYQNCAIVTITGGTGSVDSWNTGSGIYVANQEKVNSCTTAEGVDPVFPNPGGLVEYGAGLSASSAQSPANCEFPLGGKAAAPAAAQPASGNATSTGASSVPATESTTAPSSMTATGTVMSTLTSTFTTYISSLPSPSPSSMATSISIVPVSSPSSAAASTAAPSAAGNATPGTLLGPSTEVPYAGSSLAPYLPCSPGTFLCASSQTWLTCNYVPADGGSAENQGNTWKWGWTDSQTVPSGMSCAPQALSPLPSSLGQQSGAPAGYYRSDGLAPGAAGGNQSVAAGASQRKRMVRQMRV